MDDGEGNQVYKLVDEFRDVEAEPPAPGKCPEWIDLTPKTKDQGKIVHAAELLGTTPETIAFIIDNLTGLRDNVTADLGDLFDKIEKVEKANLMIHIQRQHRRIAKLELRLTQIENYIPSYVK